MIRNGFQFLMVILLVSACGSQESMPQSKGFNFFKTANADVEIASVDCPVGLLNGKTLDEEFGPGTQQITRCLEKREDVKVLYQINKACRDEACSRPYALGNIRNAINDYKITHGMALGKGFDIVAIVHSGGAPLVLDNNSSTPSSITNPFQDQMQALLDAGVKVYFCQNTARSKGIVTNQLIPGIKYITAGVTAIADFQLLGYAYVQP